MSFNAFASEQNTSDSIPSKNSTFLVSDKLESFDFEKINIESDTTKIEENPSLDKPIEKSKKIKKHKGKLLAVLTFLSGASSIILLFTAIMMAFGRSVGTAIVLNIGLGLIPITFIIGFLAIRKLKKNTDKSQSEMYNLLAMAGIALAMIPLVALLYVFALLLFSLIMGDLYM